MTGKVIRSWAKTPASTLDKFKCNWWKLTHENNIEYIQTGWTQTPNLRSTPCCRTNVIISHAWKWNSGSLRSLSHFYRAVNTASQAQLEGLPTPASTLKGRGEPSDSSLNGTGYSDGACVLVGWWQILTWTWADICGCNYFDSPACMDSQEVTHPTNSTRIARPISIFHLSKNTC